MLSGSCIIVDASDAQLMHILQVYLLEFLGQQARACARLCGSLDHFIVYIGDVLQVEDAIALLFEIACHNIESDISSGVTDMRIIINSRTADK